MLGNDLTRADFRRLIERDFVVKPRRAHHARFVSLDIAQGTRHDIADAVNHANGEACVVGQLNFDRVFRDKLRLGRHNCPPGRGLGQFVNGTVVHRVVFNVREHQRIHKPFDESGFPGTYRADHADVNVPLRALGNIFINAVFHFYSLLRLAESAVCIFPKPHRPRVRFPS